MEHMPSDLFFIKTIQSFQYFKVKETVSLSSYLLKYSYQNKKTGSLISQKAFCLLVL